jgi:hypothetical protein
MYRFHASVHARPAEATEGPLVDVGGRPYATLTVRQATLAAPFARSFETAAEALQQIGGIDLEPDGYFLWVSRGGQPRWQVDGHLYDRNERLLRVDLKGSCPVEHFDRLLSALGWPLTPLVFQLVHEAVLLDEPEFRRYAGR